MEIPISLVLEKRKMQGMGRQGIVWNSVIPIISQHRRGDMPSESKKEYCDGRGRLRINVLTSLACKNANEQMQDSGVIARGVSGRSMVYGKVRDVLTKMGYVSRMYSVYELSEGVGE